MRLNGDFRKGDGLALVYRRPDIRKFAPVRFCRQPVLEFDVTAAKRNDGRAGPVIGIELGKDVLDVVLDGMFRDAKIGRDDLVRLSFGDTAQNVQLPGSKLVVGRVLCQLLRDLGRHSPLTDVSPAYRVDEFSSQQILQQIPDRARLEGTQHLNIAGA